MNFSLVTQNACNPYPIDQVTGRVLSMLQAGQLDAATAKMLLGGQLPGSKSDMSQGLSKDAASKKRPLESVPTPSGHAGGNHQDDADEMKEFDQAIDNLLEASRKSKLDTLG